MKISRGLIFFLCLVFMGLQFSTAFAFSELDNQEFRKANKFYRENKFKEAAKSYERLTVKFPENADLQYNLGNAEFKLGNIGKSILAYERALALHPRDQDVQSNLAFVRSQQEYQIEDRRSWYLQLSDEFLKFLTVREAELLGILFWTLFLLIWVFSVFVRPNAPWGFVRKTLLFFVFISVLLYGAKRLQMHMFADAIILTKDAEVRNGPSMNDQVGFKLGEGLKVYVTEDRDDWSRIYLASGETGWIPSEQVEKVVL